MVTLIFDWSGTLFDTFEAVYETAMRVFAELGHERIGVEEYTGAIDIPYMKFWRTYFPDTPQERIEELYRTAIMDAAATKPFAGIIEVLRELKKKHTLLVLSSDPCKRLHAEAAPHNILELFDEVHCQIHDKAACLKQILVDRKLTMDQAIYVGDCDGDIRSAHAAGICAIAVSWGFHDERRLRSAQPQRIVSKPRDLLNIL